MSRSNRDRINNYFRSELDSLRTSGRDFAEAYPSIASELSLSAGISRDPHVEHLVQSFAWMMSRLRMQVESESKKIPSMLLEELAPGFVEARPPMTIAECQVDSSSVETSEDLRLEEGQNFTPINLRSGTGDLSALQNNRFSVAHSSQLWPFKVSEVSCNPAKEINELNRHFIESKSSIKISIESEAGASIGGLTVDRPIRFFINMENDSNYRFYDFLASHVIGLAVSDSAGHITHFLDKSDFTLCGFSDDERLFGLSSSELLGTSVVQDFFAFPEKFLFFEIAGLSKLRLTDYQEEAFFRLSFHLVLDQLILLKS